MKFTPLFRTLGTPILLFVVGVLCGGIAVQVWTHVSSNASTNLVTRQGSNGLLINPLISCDIAENTQSPELADIKSRIEDVVRDVLNKNTAKRISVYVRNMNTGAWTGVNTDGLFAPASLGKVPVAIAYVKVAETNPALLDKKFTLPRNDENAQQYFKSPTALTPGKTYSARELLVAMIRDSDNNAAQVLKDAISADALVSVYETFGGTPVLESDSYKNTTSAKAYMRFFRILYNASYLNKELSQQMLGVLTQSTFKGGIVAGVPENVPVAHKFGERTIQEGNLSTGATDIQALQLHDCGIVYHRNVPYGICVMTEGDSFAELAEVVATVSKEVYASVEAGMLK